MMVVSSMRRCKGRLFGSEGNCLLMFLMKVGCNRAVVVASPSNMRPLSNLLLDTLDDLSTSLYSESNIT
jgi:hypothetical protein